nr:Homeobox domain containing protein [Haemonchus contortus]
MLLLVNVERHQDVLGKIVADLVKYGVPISLVAGTDKICTRCSFVEKLSPKEQEAKLSTLVSPVPQIGLPVQATMAEVKEEPKGDRRADDNRESESPCVTATPTPMATNEVDQAIKRALRVSNTPLPGLMALPLSFFTPTCDRETSRETSKNGSCCEEEDFRLCNVTSSTSGLQASNASQAGSNADSISEQNPDPEMNSQNSASKVRVRKRRDRPLSLTKSGVARKGRKTYTERDLQILEEFYLRDPFACASPDKRQSLCHMLDIDPYRLKVWFQNRRRKDKLSFESQKIKEDS